MKQPLTTKEMAADLNKPTSTIQRWARTRLIPSMRVGWRTRLFDPDRVRAALQKLEVQAK